MIADVDKDGSGTTDYDKFEYMMTAKIGERDTKEDLVKSFHIFPDTLASKERGAKKVVSFEIDEATVTTVDGDSSVLSSVTTLSAHGTRDLREVVEEIQDEFMTASNFGKEVALLLEVGIAFCWQLYHDSIDKQYTLDLLVAEVAG
ncbi:hypothetical protein JHK87_049521 [Glycine soja]|nr:hypothetical protein JHK87_049521 [Glycine soja]